MPGNGRLNNPLTVTVTIGIFSLLAAVVCFRFLESTAGVENKAISAGGGFAGFVISFLLLFRNYHKAAERVSARADPSGPAVASLPELPKGSAYDPKDSHEATRLEAQGRLDFDIDHDAISKAIGFLGANDGLVALDVGCAGGFVTRTRFDCFEQFTTVIGLDQDVEKIHEANRNNTSPRYDFRVYDVEHENFSRDALGFSHDTQNGYDVVFSALTLHHLAEPVSALRSIGKILKDRGAVILRGSDDGSKMCYPDEKGIMATTLDMTKRSPGASDREYGRKLFGHLRQAGFEDVDVMYKVVDTIGLSAEDREALFVKSFSYRGDYLKRRIAAGQTDLRTRSEWMEKALKHLHTDFCSDGDFYYMEVVYVAIGRKGE